MTRDEAINTLANFKVYISGGGVVDKKANEALDLAIATLVNLPSADRPKGKWIPYLPEGLRYKCSECESKYDTPWHFCPNCGARMRPKLQGTHFDSIIIDECAMKGADDECL